ncbi:thioredoxin family protein [Tsuneonella amylolytica]|uniref:thioredoxin family protein n=1 Tax=Tsuneonella amylolytica TaxID=2338327 RepID=UPI001F15BB06|nr:thioredoxin family protein [Tsuneonella amylolytica]
MRIAVPLLLALSALPIAGCATAGTAPATARPDAKLFDPAADAGAQVAAARERSTVSGKPLLLVLGANWCHDSTALAGWLETPRFRQLVADGFELVFVDVGSPQTGEARNQNIARRFGIDRMKSTPALVVVSPQGQVLNARTATTWGNAASRSEDAIYREIASYAPRSRAG